MAYKTPLLRDLYGLAEDLKKSYLGNNPHRLSFILLLEQITVMVQTCPPKKMAKLLMGFIITYGLEGIIASYRFLSPERSDMYSLLDKTRLGISKTNPLSNEERLYYLKKAYDFMHENPLPDSFMSMLKERASIEEKKNSKWKNSQIPVWKNNNELISDIYSQLKQINKRNAEHIAQLVHTTPDLAALRLHIKKLPGHYQAAREERYQWMQSTDREPMIRLIKFMDESCAYIYPAVEIDKLRRLMECEKKARKGLILYVLMDIRTSLKYYFVSPKGWLFRSGSDLYKSSLTALNKNDIGEIPYEKRIQWLNGLVELIEDIKKDKEYFEQKNIEWKRNGFNLATELDGFQARVVEFRKMEEFKNMQPSKSTQAISTVTGYMAQSGLMQVMKRGGGRYLFAGVSSLVTMTGIGGIAAYTGSAIILTGLYTLVNSGKLSNVGAAVVAWMLQSTSHKIGEKTADIITKHYSVSEDGIEELRRSLSPEDELVHRRWVNTLLTLSDDIVPEEDKQHIRNVFALEQGAKLQRLFAPVKDKAPVEAITTMPFFANRNRPNSPPRRPPVIREEYVVSESARRGVRKY